MDYEICKQLKDAGFHDKHQCYSKGDGNGWPSEEGWVQIPTLEELIAALNLFNEFSLEQHSNDWRAGLYKPSIKYPDKLFCSGKTPEEAVARLWLALNKK